MYFLIHIHIYWIEVTSRIRNMDM